MFRKSITVILMIAILFSFVNLGGLTVYAENLIIGTEETYSFTSTVTADNVLTLQNRNKDYVVYYRDGSVKEYGRDSSITSLTVPNRGKAIVTARTNSISCTYNDFTVNFETNPVLNVKVIPARETFTFKNNSVAALNLLSNNRPCDYVLYAKDGSIASYPCR